MKKETIEKGKNILDLQERIDSILFKLEENSSTDRDKMYLYRVQIEVHKQGDRTYETGISFNNKGDYDGNLPLSNKSKEILTYLTKQYHQSVIRLFKTEHEEAQKEFDNLTD